MDFQGDRDKPGTWSQKIVEIAFRHGHLDMLTGMFGAGRKWWTRSVLCWLHPRTIATILDVKWFSKGTYSGISQQQTGDVVSSGTFLLTCGLALTYVGSARWFPRTAKALF